MIGTLALMNKENGNGILKKGFVKQEYRKCGILTQLYKTLFDYAKEKQMKRLMFDRPSVATNYHRFFEKVGYIRISKNEHFL